MKRFFYLSQQLILVMVFAGLAACQAHTEQASAQAEQVSQQVKTSNHDYVTCPSPRPEMCTREYRPVCASVAVDCVKAPCQTQRRTFGNGCTACANDRVAGYWPQACESDEATNPVKQPSMNVR